MISIYIYISYVNPQKSFVHSYFYHFTNTATWTQNNSQGIFLNRAANWGLEVKSKSKSVFIMTS